MAILVGNKWWMSRTSHHNDVLPMHIFFIILLCVMQFLITSEAKAAVPVLVDAGNGTVVDTANNLTWLKNANCFSESQGWGQLWGAATSSSNNLASGQCGLYDNSKPGDWHLATSSELSSVYLSSPLTSGKFINVQNSAYWSSTKVSYYTYSYYWVHMGDGGVGNSTSDNPKYVWPVRSGQYWAVVLSPINIIKSGSGSGSIASNPSGISCGSTCSYNFTSGQSIILTASASSGSTFNSWVGCNIPNGNQCTVAADGTTNSITAVFEDNLPPTISFSSVPLSYSNQASGMIAFTADEAATFECKVDSGTYTSCTSPFSYSGLANGQHTVAIKATDGAGNTSTSTKTWTVNTALAASSAILLPQTGQTKCYNSTGTEIGCDGTGQDGDIQAGVPWPNPRFTDNGYGTVTDNLTELQWTKDANLAGTKTWQEALDYVTAMNNANNGLGTSPHA